MDNRLLVARQSATAGGLLDLVPGAAAAYSLRSLSKTYTDPVVTVRRSSDNDEAPFTASEVADGTLAAFCGAGDGFVKQWWDQSGNANHASQTTPGYQPKIVSSGVVILEEGKPAIQFDGSDDSLDANALASTFSGVDKPISAATLFKCATGVSYPTVFSFGNSAVTVQYLILRSGLGVVEVAVRDNAFSGILSSGGDALSQNIAFFFSNMDTVALRVNGIATDEDSASLGTVTLNVFSIGCFVRTTKSQFFQGTIQELVIYPANITAQAELVEGNTAWSYSV